MNIGVKIRLYPNGEQTTQLNSLLGAFRFVYNQCLALKQENKKAKLSDYGYLFHHILRDKYEWLQEHNTHVLKQSFINLHQTCAVLSKRGGQPKFKNKHDVQKVRFPEKAIASKTFNEIENKLNLTKKVRGLKFRCSEKHKTFIFQNKENIKSITITKNKCGQFYASILLDVLNFHQKPTIENKIGIDIGIKNLITTSTGETIGNPRLLSNSLKKLKRLQRKLRKKKKDSKNRERINHRIRKLFEKIRNKRQNYLHTLTTRLINENQVIIMEDLYVKGLMKNRKVARNIAESGWYELRRQLEYKARWYGRNLIFVNRFFPSSKMCSNCGWKKEDLTLSHRIFECDSCGKSIDRDYNAAINIEKEGVKIFLGLR
jgi:putative transposase